MLRGISAPKHLFLLIISQGKLPVPINRENTIFGRSKPLPYGVYKTQMIFFVGVGFHADPFCAERRGRRSLRVELNLNVIL